MKKVLLIVLIILGVLLMLKPVSAIIKDSQENIIYRGNVVTGTVAVDNGNGSYDVYIGESAEAYPSIFTLAENPDLEVGDKVRILYENGIKELPIILPPRAAAVSETVYLIAVIVQPYSGNQYIAFYNTSGELQNTYSLSNVYFETDCIAVDRYGNAYYIKNSNVLTKINSSGEELLTKSITGYPESIAIGADGYIYTREQDGKIHKRKTTDFVSQSYITLTSGKNYYALAMDSSGNFYIVNSSDDRIEKWSSDGVKLVSYGTQDYSYKSSMAITSNYFYRVASMVYGYFYKNESKTSLVNIEYPHGCGSLSNAFLVTGEVFSDSNLYLEKYAENNALQWSVCVDDSANSPDDSMVAAYPF